MLSQSKALTTAFTLACFIANDAVAQPKSGPNVKFDDSGANVIEVSNLPSDGCPTANSVGRITKRHIDKGKFLAVDFRDRRRSEYINLPDASEFQSKVTYELVSNALDRMLKVGAEVRVKMAACGAGGAIVALESVTLVNLPQGQTAPSAVSSQTPLIASGSSGTTEAASSNAAGGGPAGASQNQTASKAPALHPGVSSVDVQNAKDGWLVQGDASFTSIGLVAGMHYHTIQLICRHESGLVELLIDDPKARYRAGSPQIVSLGSGTAKVTIRGTSTYNEMDEIRQVAATLPLATLEPILRAMESGGQLRIETRAGRLLLARGAGAKSASVFLSSCSRHR